MELDEELKQKILSLDENALRESAMAVARQMGVDERRVQAKLRDPAKIKKALTGLTQKDLDRLSAHFGDEKSEELMRAVQRELKEK